MTDDEIDTLRRAPTSPAPPVSRGSGVREAPTLATLPPPALLPHFDGHSVARCGDAACTLCADDAEVRK